MIPYKYRTSLSLHLTEEIKRHKRSMGALAKQADVPIEFVRHHCQLSTSREEVEYLLDVLYEMGFKPKKRKVTKTRVQFRLPVEVKEYLDDYCESRGITKVSFITSLWENFRRNT